MNPGATSVALFGGTFDPVHNGHLRMAVEVKEALGLPRVVLFPSHRPPHKPKQPLTEDRHRLAMVAAATTGISGLEVSDVEVRRGGASYSLLTVMDFRRDSPSSEFIFIIGADAFAEISTWHRYEELLSACDFILLPRPGSDAEPASPAGVRIEKEEPHCYSWKGKSYRIAGGRRLFCPSLPALEISSSSIREKVRTGKCIRGLVPPDVERYIYDHGLYLDPGEGRRS
ncbi:MAG: nicotinate (nicotinamide) nucleotide adenylyltransferase [Deltaproteobacteria bacterium]|nr:nicotinate (nicotinamide) nucleotide adenylyltransferase [Deltaproteobacteria bacterium]